MARCMSRLKSTAQIVGYLYKRGIERNQLGYASAVGLVLLVLALVINVVQLVCNGTFKKEED